MDVVLSNCLVSVKEIQCGLLLEKKPGVLLLADGAFNLTLPSQPPILVKGQLQETTKDYFKVNQMLKPNQATVIHSSFVVGCGRRLGRSIQVRLERSLRAALRKLYDQSGLQHRTYRIHVPAHGVLLFVAGQQHLFRCPVSGSNQIPA